MDAAVNCIDKYILEPFCVCVCRRVECEVGYILDWEENRKNLIKKVTHLKTLKRTVRATVKIAKAEGKMIKVDVEKWQDDVQKLLPTLEEEVNKYLNGKPILKSLDASSRYTLGKKWKNMVTEVDELSDLVNGFQDQVAYDDISEYIGEISSACYFDTRKSALEDIIKALTDDKISKIGIYGMPGVGKTAVVEQVRKQAKKHRFDGVATAVFSQNPEIHKIQERLADSLHLPLPKESEEGRASQLWNRLSKGKILVILDDVWDGRITLNRIGIPEDCKTLLTSRSVDVCRQMGFKNNFPIRLLSKPESWLLFRRTVGDCIKTDGELHSVAKQVCGECDGLSLAICAVGGALHGQKDSHVWDYALEQLKHGHGYKLGEVKEKVYPCIELSYDYLEHQDVKSCFLHCCLFAGDADISMDQLVWFGVGTRFLESTDRTSFRSARGRTHAIVAILKKSSLLLESGQGNKVKMHGVVRHVALSIASRDPNFVLVRNDVDVWPDKDEYRCCRTISFRTCHRVHGLPRQLDCPELRTFVLEHISDAPGEDSKLQLSSSFFEGMENLEVLVLKNIKLVLSSLSHLVTLRMLRLSNCQFVDLSFPRELENLEMLAITHTNRGEAMVLDIGQLTRLRWLDLRGFEDGIGFSTGSKSCLSKLEAYNIELGSSVSHYKETKKLGIRNIPSMDGLEVLMVNAEVLCLDSVKCLENLGFSDVDSFGGLTVLKVHGCESMKYLFSPSTARYLVKLEELVIADCEKLEEIIGRSDDDVADKVIFHQLKRMRLHNLPKLISVYPNINKTSTTKRNLQPPLFNQKVMFPVLEALDIRGLNQIQTIWDKQLLRVLEVGNSFRLLQNFSASYCERMEEILAYEDGEAAEPHDKNHAFPHLSTIRLVFLPKLKRISIGTWGDGGEQDDKATLQALVNQKVKFPGLKRLVLWWR